MGMTLKQPAKLTLVLTAILLFPYATWAQQPPPSGASAWAVDLSPIIDGVIKVAALMVAAVGLAMVKRVWRWLGLKGDNEAAKLAEPILQNGLAFGQALVSRLITEKFPDLTRIEVKDQIVKHATDYAVNALATELKGIDRRKVEDWLMARLEANISAQTDTITATAAAPMPTTVAVTKAPDITVVPIPTPVVVTKPPDTEATSQPLPQEQP